MPTRLDPDEYTVAWIAVLQIEAEAALGVLDRRHDGHFESGRGDDYIYIGGELNGHNIVIATLPEGSSYGVAAGAALVNQVKSRFEYLWFTLVVGVAAGIPSLPAEDSAAPRRDIRLGDVLVCVPQKSGPGIVQYDLGTYTDEGLQISGRQAETSALVRSAIGNIKLTKPRPFKQGNEFATYLNTFQANVDDEKFRCRSQEEDLLYSTALDSANSELIHREPRDASERTKVWYGLIGSGNLLMRNAVERNRLRDEHDLIGLEMESAGIMNSLPAGVIRGVCDYEDAQKNKKWQPYAAAVAAVYAKGILLTITPRSSKRFRTGLDSSSELSGQKRSKTNDYHLWEGQRSHNNSAQRRRCIDSLKFDQMKSRHADIQPACAQTCQWLFSKPEFKTWTDDTKLSEHHGVLWIKGKPGTGKSTITKFAFQQTKKKEHEAVVVSFFFHARGAALEKSTKGMYRSLLAQLLEESPDLQDMDELFSAVRNDESHEWDLQTLKTLFREVVPRIRSRAVILFIDALDECDEEEIRDMFRLLETLGESAVSSNRVFRACVSSRHYPHITISKGVSFILEDQDGHKNDLAVYIKKELRIGNSQIADQIRFEVLEKSCNIFLWAVLVIPILNKEYDSGRVHALQKQLRIVPTDLEKLFDNIITREGPPSSEFISCLQWLLFSRRPLHPDELYFAILAGIEDNFPYIRDDTTDDWIYKYILNCSKGLAEITRTKHKTVQFIHESVRDFFFKGPGLTRSYFQPADTFAARSHNNLKYCCQRYYQNEKILDSMKEPATLPKANSTEAADLRSLHSKEYPFLEYAISSVLFHCDTAQQLGHSQGEFVGAFDKTSWQRLNNIMVRYETRRYSSDDSLLHISEDLCLPSLMVVLLRESIGPKLNDRDSRGRTLLIRASSKGNEDMVRPLLLQNGIDINLYDKKKRTALTWAAKEGHHGVVRLLLEQKDIDIHCKDHLGRSALSWASKLGHYKTVALLLALDRVDVNSLDKEAFSPLVLAFKFKHYTVAELLLTRSELFPTMEDLLTMLRGMEQSQQTDSSSRSILMQIILSPRTDINQPIWGRRTILGWTAEFNYTRATQLLLMRGDIDVNREEPNGKTPLLRAAARGSEGTTRLLLSRNNIDPNRQDKYGRAALLLAAENDHEATTKQLLSHPGTKINLPDHDGCTALWYATFAGAEKTSLLLLGKPDVDVNLQGRVGYAALSFAAASGSTAVVKRLLSRSDIKADIEDSRRYTPLYYAVAYCHYGIMSLFLERSHTNPNRAIKDGGTPLMLTVMNKDVRAAKILLQEAKNLAVDQRDKNGRTALFWAAFVKCDEISELLVQYGADTSAIKNAHNLTEAEKQRNHATVSSRRNDCLCLEHGLHQERYMRSICCADIEIGTLDDYVMSSPL